MKKIFFIFAFAFLIFILTNSVNASISDVKYPVAELGNCNSQAECEKYCDDVNNMEPCLNFAEKNGIMTSDEIAEARKFMPLMKSMDTPGGCKNQKECKAFCDNDNNLEICLEFAKKAGVISQEEYEMVKKTGGKGPGDCKGKKECEDFCNDDANFNVCIDFAKEKGLITQEDYDMAKKTGGKGPGDCKKEECDNYCKIDANFNVCLDFAKEHGLISDSDYEMVKKTGGKGPGDCKNKEECDAFCNNPDNQETCTNFAIEHDLLSGTELENLKKNQEFTNSEEGKCYSQCMKEAGISYKDCPEGGGGPESCKSCQDKCFSHDQTSGGKCLSQERWQQLNQECQSKGGGYNLQEVKGDNGNGGECVVDETCVQGSGNQWETQEEKDRKLAEMQKQWDADRAQYEAEHGPSSQQENSGGSGNGCTQPGPEGQCNPGPGAGPGPGSEGSGSQEQTSGGESVAGTGAVIMKTNSNGIITRLIE